MGARRILRRTLVGPDRGAKREAMIRPRLEFLFRSMRRCDGPPRTPQSLILPCKSLCRSYRPRSTR
jgi:hypothetical protein